MPRNPLTAFEIEEHRRAICAAATKLFARRGYPAVTMRAIAAETRRSHMAAYRYVRSKSEIFQLVRAEAFRRLADALDAVRAEQPDPRRRFRALIARYVEFALADPDAYRLMFELTQGPKDEAPAVRAEIARTFEHAWDAARILLQAGAAEGDEVTLAHFVWSAIHGMVSLHLAEHLIHERSLEGLVEPLIGFFLGGTPRRAGHPAPRRTPARRRKPAASGRR